MDTRPLPSDTYGITIVRCKDTDHFHQTHGIAIGFQYSYFLFFFTDIRLIKSCGFFYNLCQCLMDTVC